MVKGKTGKGYTKYKLDEGFVLIHDELGKEIAIGIDDMNIMLKIGRSTSTYHVDWDSVLKGILFKLRSSKFKPVDMETLISIESSCRSELRVLEKKIMKSIPQIYQLPKRKMCDACEYKNISSTSDIKRNPRK